MDKRLLERYIMPKYTLRKYYKQIDNALKSKEKVTVYTYAFGEFTGYIVKIVKYAYIELYIEEGLTMRLPFFKASYNGCIIDAIESIKTDKGKVLYSVEKYEKVEEEYTIFLRKVYGNYMGRRILTKISNIRRNYNLEQIRIKKESSLILEGIIKKLEKYDYDKSLNERITPWYTSKYDVMKLECAVRILRLCDEGKSFESFERIISDEICKELLYEVSYNQYMNGACFAAEITEKAKEYFEFENKQ